jgi:hypothetical protein
MKMRSIVIFITAALLLVSQAKSQTLDADGVPANGATVILKPTSLGYEGDISLPAGKYTNATVKSFDPAIANILEGRLETREESASSGTGADQSQTPPKTFASLITVLVNSGAIKQGSYRFTLKLDGPKPVARDLLLSVPASQLDAIDTLVVVSEWWKPFDTQRANQPQFWETSQKKWLTNITLDQKGQTEAGVDPTGEIKPKGKLDDIAPGKNERIYLGKHYELNDRFPLGTAKGKLSINADQLSAPVTFNFEVRSRIWVVWLFPMMILGLFFGYFTRHWLADFLARSQEKKRCYDLVDLIDGTLKEKTDATFQTAAKVAKQQAEQAAKKTKAADIKAACDQAQSAFESAIADLKTRREGLAQQIAQLTALADANYDLPQALKQALQTARTDSAAVSKQADNDVVEATRAFKDETKTLQKAGTKAGTEWLKAVADIGRVIELPKRAFGLDFSDIDPRLKATANQVQAAVDKLAIDTTASIPLLKELLDALHSNIYALSQLRGVIAARVSDQLDGLAQTLQGAQLPDTGSWKAWLSASRQFAQALGSISPEDPAIGTVYDLGSPLPKQLANALQSQTDKPDLQAAISAFLDQNKVAEAVAKLADSLMPSINDGRMLGGEREAVPGNFSGSAAAITSAALVMPKSTPIVFTQPLAPSTEPDSAEIGKLRARIAWQIETAGKLQTAIFGVLIIFAGYFLFADKWVGTPGDFAAVLFWAFGTDVGADALATVTKNFNK